jgi:O-antigen ligase
MTAGEAPPTGRIPHAASAAWGSGETGLRLLLAAIAWTLLCAVEAGGHAAPVIGACLAAAAGWLGGRVMAQTWRMSRAAVPALVCTAGAAVLLPPLASRWGVLAGPASYPNARAELMLQCVLAAALAAGSVRSRAGRAAAWAAAAIFATAVLTSGSKAAATLLVGSAVLYVACSQAHRLRTARVVAALAVLGAVCVTAGIAAGNPAPRARGGAGELLATALSQRRLVLWHDALSIMLDHPWVGVGPGRFKAVSPAALSDEDAVWAHDEFLQEGAEGGVAALVLLLLCFAWGFASLGPHEGESSGSARTTALGLAALMSLGVHASIDYVLHFPLLVTAAAALVGATVAGEATR